MAVDTLIKQLLEAGVHFGHQTKRWNPKMKSYIFGERSGIYIIDLQQTAQLLQTACGFLQQLAANGKSVLFVGTKRQAQEVIGSCAARCGMYYVNERWLGGTLTNFNTIRKSVKRLQDLQALLAPDSRADLTKKEKAVTEKEIARMKKKLSGIVEMENLPAAVVIVDPKKEENAVREARLLSIPVVALLDTNCDPQDIDYPIPGNDDAIRAIKFVVSFIADAVAGGREKYLEVKKPKKAPPSEERKEEGEAVVSEPVAKEEELLIEEITEKVEQPEEPQIRNKQPKAVARRPRKGKR